MDDEPLKPYVRALSGLIDLDHVELCGEYSAADLSGDMSQVRCHGTDFTDANVLNLTMVDTEITHSELSNGRWQRLSTRRVELMDCRALGWRAEWDFAEEVLIAQCRLDYSQLRFARTRGAVVFRECTFAEATIGGDLSRIVFDDCDLRGSEFRASAAVHTNLATSQLVGARGITTLRGAVISAGQAVGLAPTLAAEAGFVVERSQ